jgi:colicin import membrane protein
MTMATNFRTTLLGLALGACALGAGAQDFGQPVVGAPIVPPTHSVEQADAKLAEVATRRAAAEAAFAEREQVCYARFFVNRCLDKAKEARRGVLAELRAIDAEASRFKRAESVGRRDQALADAQKTAQDTAIARAAAPPKRLPVAADPVRAPAAGKTPAQRQGEYDAKVQGQAARDAAEAAGRAANVAKYDAKQLEAAERQRKVAAKLAENAEKARKAAADKAAADAAAAAKAAAAAAEAKK